MVVRMVILCPLPPRWSRAERPQVDDSRPLILVGPLGLEPPDTNSIPDNELPIPGQARAAKSCAVADADGLRRLAEDLAALNEHDREAVILAARTAGRK